MTRKWMMFWLAAGMAVATAQAASDEVKIETGRLKGVARDGVVGFKGIPFAAAPVGDLRWRAPAPVKAWTGVRAAAGRPSWSSSSSCSVDISSSSESR